MPELPDVAGFEARFNHSGRNRRMVHTAVPDPRILKGGTPQSIGQHLKNRTFRRTRRHGKYLFALTDNPGALVMHFGMTGSLAFYGTDEDPPSQEKLRIDFDDGGHFAYTSQRLLGHVEWTEDVSDWIGQQQLGPDALDDALTKEKFIERMASRRGMLKSALMNQSILAGIGNVYADEILFQSKLPPDTRLTDMSPEKCRAVYPVMRRVLRTAARARAEGRPLPKSYLTPHRHADMECPRCSGKLDTVKISGRTSCFCPVCQQ